MTPGDSAKLLRCVIAAVFLVVFGAGASWVVRRDAAQYRLSLKQEARPETVVVDENSSISTPVTENVPPTLSKPRRVGSERAPRQKRDTTKPARAQAKVAVEKQVSHAPEPPEKSKSVEEKDKESAVAQAYTADVKKVFDIDHLSPDDERRLGAILHDLILKITNRAPDGPETGRVFDIGGDLFAKFNRRDITVTILNSPEFNAFSHPGGQGFLYITTGMLERIGTEEDYVLKFAIAHELGHLELGHTLQCLQFRDMRELMKGGSVGTAEALCQLVIPNAHKDEMELAADQWALVRMKEAGHDRYEALKYLRKLQAYAKEQNFLQGHIFPNPGAERSLLDNHIRAHVRVKERLDRAESFWDGKPAPK